MVAAKYQNPHDLLEKALKRTLKKNPSYSIRSIARTMKISPSFLSSIFKGKKKLPPERFEEITKILGMDDSSKNILKRALLFETLRTSKNSQLEIEKYIGQKELGRLDSIAARDEGTVGEFSVFDSWYQMAILDLVTCVDFKMEMDWIAGRLGIKRSEAELAVDRLRYHGFIIEENGRWVKVSEKLRFPTTRSYPAIRTYHKMMITRALQALLGEQGPEAFDRRLITAISFASNREHIQKGKARLMELIYEISDIMTEGDCTDIYQLNVQLFPLTQNS